MVEKNLNEIDVDSLYRILANQQRIIAEMQDQINFTLPRLEAEIDTVKEENIKLNNIIYDQEKQIKILNMKVYHCTMHNKGNYAELSDRYNMLSSEIEKIDTAMDVILLENLHVSTPLLSKSTK
tara:strand:+ start:126 stop:497 length:372 start_codon:yes stop_codon:yes gene_type:complete